MRGKKSRVKGMPTNWSGVFDLDSTKSLSHMYYYYIAAIAAIRSTIYVASLLILPLLFWKHDLGIRHVHDP